MESFPAAFVARLEALAKEVGLWVDAQLARDAASATDRLSRVDGLVQTLVDGAAAAGVPVLGEALCWQLRDVAVTAAAVTLARACGAAGTEAFVEDFVAASEPRPRALQPALWRRVQDLFWAAARVACARRAGPSDGDGCLSGAGRIGGSGAVAPLRQEQRLFDRLTRLLAGGGRGVAFDELPVSRRETFHEEVARVMPATVVMLSTGFDEPDPSSGSRTPYSARVEGRCTELMLSAMGELEGRSWIELLWAMRRLAARSSSGAALRPGSQQVPLLTCSRMLDLGAQVRTRQSSSSGQCRALLVGVNYTGQEGLEIQVGHRDVMQMRLYLMGQGFPAAAVRVLADDGEHQAPSRANIEASMKWLVEGARPGDSFFFHYSGHGSSLTVEAESPFGGDAVADEALCPVDFRTAGMLFDDEVYNLLVAPLKEGVLLTCVIDCCQSGTVLHLPFVFKASAAAWSGGAVEADAASAAGAVGRSRGDSVMEPNADYDADKMLQVIKAHPAMSLAASFWAEDLAAQDPSRYGAQLGSALSRVAQAWASEPEE